MGEPGEDGVLEIVAALERLLRADRMDGNPNVADACAEAASSLAGIATALWRIGDMLEEWNREKI